MRKDIYDQLVAAWNDWNAQMLPETATSFTDDFSGDHYADHIGLKPASLEPDPGLPGSLPATGEQPSPFKGGVEAITEVITGRVDFACMGVPSALPFIDDNELLALAVCTQRRTASLPNVATTIELGYPDSDYNYWMGMFVPAKTDRAILEKLRAETQRVMADPDTVEKLKPQGMEPMPLSPAEFDALVRKEVAENITLVKAAGIKVD